MYDISLKVSYVKGLVEGLEIEDEKVKRVLSEIISILDDMADAINDLKMTIDDTQEYVECIDEDLGELEDDFYELDEKNYRLVGRRTKREYRLGQPVSIQVAKANLERKQLDFVLA